MSKQLLRHARCATWEFSGLQMNGRPGFKMSVKQAQLLRTEPWVNQIGICPKNECPINLPDMPFRCPILLPSPPDCCYRLTVRDFMAKHFEHDTAGVDCHGLAGDTGICWQQEQLSSWRRAFDSCGWVTLFYHILPCFTTFWPTLHSGTVCFEVCIRRREISIKPFLKGGSRGFHSSPHVPVSTPG